MTDKILEFAARCVAEHGLGVGRNILEIGSRNVNGTVRSVVAGAKSYIGIDIEAGPGVDLVMPNADTFLAWDFGEVDCILCCECLEHNLRPWKTVARIHELLPPGGQLLVTTPTFGFPLHRYPIDCYRFGEDAYRGWIFDGFEILAYKQIEEHPIICCFGVKN